MSILILKPTCKDYLWGGQRLKTEYNVSSDLTPLAEAWVLSAHPDGPSVIANGEYAGQTLAEYIEKEGKSVLGNFCALFSDFPILIKLIDARNNLSIQVHPSDEYAMRHEGQYGKTEMWYVLDAEPDAFLYYGFQHPISKDEFQQRIENNTLTDVLNAVPVKRGDLFYIPAGTLHAICKGIVLAEVQQSSNVTYRVYDYGRVGADGAPRALHVQSALDVTQCVPPKNDWDFDGHLVKCKYFTTDVSKGDFSDTCDQNSFTSLLVLDGQGTIRNGNETLPLETGESIFLPAGSGEFFISGDCSVLRTRIGA